MDVYKSLLLDSSYYPIQIIDWRKAMILFFTGRAEVVEHHQDIEIHSTNDSYTLPSVLRLFRPFNAITRVKFNRRNVFTRDKYTCQYCGNRLEHRLLTFDHVMPKSRGGKTSWENIVTSCHPCNNKKADRTPEECGFSLLKRPYEPSWHPFMGLRLKKEERLLWGSWIRANSA
jgi:5-methylcytosine-specific restriction endonuclease McrA